MVENLKDKKKFSTGFALNIVCFENLNDKKKLSTGFALKIECFESRAR